jgi:hypothetical protein
MKKYLFLLVCPLLWFAGVTSGQNITHAEYFFDTDPGVGNGTAIELTAGEEVNFTATVSTEGLDGGFHTIFVRFRNEEGVWSLAHGSSFYVNTLEPVTLPALAFAEYFFDDDPGVNNGTPVTIVIDYEIGFALEIALNNHQELGPGFHHLYLRSKDLNGTWGLSQGRAFYIPDTTMTEPSFPMVAAEYYMDDDPGFGMGFPLTFNTGFEVEETFMLPVSDLSDGEHLLFVRFKNDHETWGLPKSCEFSVTSVGVDSYSDDQFLVYPNPAINFIKVEIAFAGEIEILDMNGKIRIRRQIQPGSTTIGLAEMPAGIYLLRCSNPDKIFTKRFVVLKP